MKGENKRRELIGKSKLECKGEIRLPGAKIEAWDKCLGWWREELSVGIHHMWSLTTTISTLFTMLLNVPFALVVEGEVGKGGGGVGKVKEVRSHLYGRNARPTLGEDGVDGGDR